MRPPRIGLLVPNTDTSLEWDLQRAFGGRCSIHTERIYLENVTVEAELKMVEEETPRALEYLRPIQPEVIVFGCTSAGALYGVDGEAAFTRGLGESLGCPSISAFGSVLAHIACLKITRLSLFTPYTAEVHTKVANSIREAGVTIIWEDWLGLVKDEDIGNLDPALIAERLGHAPTGDKRADAVFASCTNLRVDEISAGLSGELGQPVFGSNTAIIAGLRELSFPSNPS